MVNNPGKRITDFDVAGSWAGAFQRAPTLQNAASGFRSTGIASFNPHIFDNQDFVPSSLTKIVIESKISLIVIESA